MAIKFDKILEELREKDIIPQYDGDPASPNAEETWVKHVFTSGGAGAGEPYGLLLALTKPGDGAGSAYQLSYRTKQGTTVRVTLS